MENFTKAFDAKLGDLYKAMDTSTGSVRDLDSYMKSVNKQLAEVKDMTQEFEIEHGDNRSAKGIIKSCNEKLRQAKKAIMEKEAQLSKAQERELFGEEEIIDEEEGKTANYLRQNRMLQEGRRNLGQGMEYATNISGELTRQKEKLQKSIHTTNEITGDLGMSASLIGSIARIRRKNKFIYYSVVILAFTFFVYLIAKKLFL